MWNRSGRNLLRLAAQLRWSNVDGSRAAGSLLAMRGVATSGGCGSGRAGWASSAAMLMVAGAAVLGFAPSALADSPAAAAAAAAAREELTYIMVKPDGVNRGLVSEVLGRFERRGYKLVGLKVLVPPPSLAAQHYAEHDGKPFFPKLVDFLSSGPVVAMVWEGKGVVAAGRKMIGVTNPLASEPGTLRGDFGIDVGRNIVHGSDSVESAQREIALWFKAEELASYDATQCAWVYE